MEWGIVGIAVQCCLHRSALPQDRAACLPPPKGFSTFFFVWVCRAFMYWPVVLLLQPLVFRCWSQFFSVAAHPWTAWTWFFCSFVCSPALHALPVERDIVALMPTFCLWRGFHFHWHAVCSVTGSPAATASHPCLSSAHSAQQLSAASASFVLQSSIHTGIAMPVYTTLHV